MASINYDHHFKILLIGDAGVGKSSILSQFSDSVFTTSHISTIGVDFKHRTIILHGNKIRLQIWDTAGQERFQSVASSYYRGAHGIILVYDSTNQESFMNAEKWIARIEENAPKDVVKMIIANKCDITADGKIPRENGLQIASNYGALFAETSAKTNTNIDKSFIDITEAILKTIQQQPAPKKHHGIRLGRGRNGESRTHKRC